ncbi:acetylcholinesterase [Pieris rapae]|uniref:acetylcholinesterase n=1 Tax=Pieris rapae TaxID=64459 RepID=UPI001E27D7E2|nr:acetylcholinesterase [Pieris rapae]XP_045484312.1 acetylcholinesterase [Pieris rapae]
MGWRWLVLWSMWLAGFVRQPTLNLRISSGILRGSVSPDGTYLHYNGIPYAEITQRFRKPGPEPTWDGIFEAINENIRCHQRIGTNLVVGQEDCLTLNVYTPVMVDEGTNLPVMVYIHGGGFFDGSGSSFIYGPNNLINKGVILVTINYRLNIQGFICLGIKEAPGNAGMKDQVAALQWVRRNIKAFGGNPDNVTLFGESAGSSSVSFHILSHMSKGLFHRAILQSGSSLSPWALQYRPVYMASLLTKVMLHSTEDAFELYNILMNKTDAELVVTRVPRKEGNVIFSELLYVPCVEEEIDGEEPFLTEHPHDILSKGKYNKVPVMIGMNSNEGYLFAAMENNTVVPKIDVIKSLPKDLLITSDKERCEVGNMLKEIYMIDNNMSSSNFLNLAKFHGEIFFSYPTIQETELYLMTNNEPVYSYIFNYSGNRNFLKKSLGEPFSSAPGATHADELFYIFSQYLIPNLFENQMIEKMTTMWTNFAKYGEPTPETTELLPLKWHPSTKASPHSLVIDSQFSIVPMGTSESIKYLRRIYAKYRRKQTRDL